MKYFFVFLAVFVVPFVAATELRKEKMVVSKHALRNVKANQIAGGGAFPSSPSYVSVLLYDDITCATLANAQTALVNTCFTDGSSSQMFTCTGGTSATIRGFNDVSCTTEAFNATLTATCGSVGGSMGAKLVGCTSNGLSFGGGESYTALATYNVAGCASDLLGAGGYINGQCYQQSSTTSTIWTWPNMYAYTTTADCTGTVVTTDLSSSTCTTDGSTDDAITDLAYSKYLDGTSSGASSNVAMNFGVLASLMMVVMQFLKN